MKFEKGMRALSLLMVVVLFGAIFIPMVSAEEIRILDSNEERVKEIENTFIDISSDDSNWLLTNGGDIILVSGTVPEFTKEADKKIWDEKLLNVISDSNLDLKKYMTLNGGPLVCYGLNYLGSIEVGWYEDVKADPTILKDICNMFYSNAEEKGIKNLPIVVKYVSKFEGDISRSDYFRPVIGGIQMYIQKNGNTYAGTIGFAAKKSGQNGFVVSEHVVESTSTTVYQPTVSTSYITNTANTLGGTYADAAFVPYSNVEATILDRNLLRQSVKGYSDPYVGQQVYMAGLMTQSYGSVTHIGESVDNYDLGRTLQGQCIASYSRNNGDSGAPVFTIATNHDRKIAGIHSAQSNLGATFSPVSGVIYDLGITPLTR
ncbi:MAG: hypothetical protein KAW93_03485 [Methanogenium sp.]|nr:hypothetical protein [Methanogenium sp.]